MTTSPSLQRPSAAEYPQAFGRYIGIVPEGEILATLSHQIDEVNELFSAIPSSREEFRYAPGKWSIRVMAGHLADAERLFGFRALTFARADAGPLPGFSEDDYVKNASFGEWPLAELVAEWDVSRRSNIFLLRHLSPEACLREGVANGNRITVRALAFAMAGHVQHHLGVLRERSSVGSR